MTSTTDASKKPSELPPIDARSIQDLINEKEKGRKRHATFDTEEDTVTGKFQHYRRRKRKFFYEDIRRGEDRYSHLDVGTECDLYFRGKRVQYKITKSQIFFHVVDLDDYEYHKVVFHTYLNSVLQSFWFKTLILALVLLSAVLIGVTTSPSIKDRDDVQRWFKIIDQVILSVFIFEIVVKWMYDFRLFWEVWWNIIDFAIVFMIVITAIFPIFEGNNSSNALVIVRVVRAFRSLKSISSLSSLTIVSHTIVRSGVDMANILLVLIIFMFVMAVMGVILFDSEEVDTKWFLNGLNAWFLLFICVTQDGWNSVLDEFRDFTSYFPYLAVYLILAVSIGAFVFANLIVAVIVANLELSVKEQREEARSSDDPLDTQRGFIINELEITPTYDLFSKNNVALLAQRPMKLPNFRHFSIRRLQTYVQLIVALEQNMLEAEIIRLDFEKILAVILSIIVQLNVYSAKNTEKEQEVGASVVDDIKRFTLLEEKKSASKIVDNLGHPTYKQKRVSDLTLHKIG